MDSFFQKFCDKYPIYLFNTKFKKKIFYILFSLLQYFLKGPFLIKFKLFSIFVYPDKNDYTRFILTRVTLPDPRERELIINNLTNNKNVFIDCGANSGFYSLDVSTKVKNVEIFAFEPSDKEFNFLKRNIEINNIKNITPIKLALGNETGEIYFNDMRSSNLNLASGGGYVSKNLIDKAFSYKVKITTLNDYFSSSKFSNDTSIFIKIDLEGYDFNAIFGATDLIHSYDCSIIFEFSKMIISNPDYSAQKINSLIAQYNLNIYDIYGNSLNLVDLEEKIKKLDDAHDTCGNFILTKKNLNFN